MSDILSNSAGQVTFALAAIGRGFVVSVFASRRAVTTNTAELAVGTGLPFLLVGFTLLAIGTDLPEIVNSIVASLAGKGALAVLVVGFVVPGMRFRSSDGS